MSSADTIIFMVLVSVYSNFVASDDISGKDPPPGSYLWGDKLRKDLLRHYDVHTRPAQHDKNTTTVKVGLAVSNYDLDEVRGAVLLDAWMRLLWTDERLKWDEEEYGGTDLIRFADHELWQPDVVLYNDADYGRIDTYANAYALVYPKGEVLWVPPASLQARCSLDLSRWPYDEHHCQLHFGSWTYDGEKIDLQFYDSHTKMDLELFRQNSAWEIIPEAGAKNTTFYDCCAEPYTKLIFNVKFRRHSGFYAAVITLPAVVVTLTTLATFWISPKSGEKIIISSFNAFISIIFIVFLAIKVPSTGQTVPYFVAFYGTTLVFVSLSLVVGVVVINLSRICHQYPVPQCLRRLINSQVGFVLGLAHVMPMLSSSHNPLVANDRMDTSSDHRDSVSSTATNELIHLQSDWPLVAIVINRLSFVIYSVTFIILFAVYF